MPNNPDYTNDKEYVDAFHNEQHKKFCILPFIHLATTTEGNCRLCCKVSRNDVITDSNGNPYNVNTHSIDEIWNSEYMRDIRLRLLNDEQIPECNTCWHEEEVFYSEWMDKEKRNELPSKRRKENQKWLHKDKTKLAATFDDIVLTPKIRYFDIRLSNLCNLKCRMCWPQFSTQIAKEQQQFEKANKPTWYNDFDIAEWDTAKLWEGITSNILDIEEITFVGGEPTLHEEMYELLDKLIELGISKNIRLKFTTNLTNVQQRLIDAIPHFRNVVVNTSIDGVDKVNNYIRNPSDWNTISTNLDKLLAMLADNNLSINITPVIQIYNIFDIGNIVKWYVEKWIEFPGRIYFGLDLDLLYQPSYLSANLMSRKGKDIWYNECLDPTVKWLDDVINNIELQEKDVSDYWTHIVEVKKLVINIAKYLETMRLDENGKLIYKGCWSIRTDEQLELVKQLKAYTTQLDKHRKENIYDIIPNWDDIL